MKYRLVRRSYIEHPIEEEDEYKNSKPSNEEFNRNLLSSQTLSSSFLLLHRNFTSIKSNNFQAGKNLHFFTSILYSNEKIIICFIPTLFCCFFRKIHGYILFEQFVRFIISITISVETLRQ